MEHYYVLDEHGVPAFEADPEAWVAWAERARLHVARSTVRPDIAVLTTFRGVDDREDKTEPPLLFETRVFGGSLDGEETRYGTRAEALAGHDRLVQWCRIGAEAESCVAECGEA